jgi:hypothetical protein
MIAPRPLNRSYKPVIGWSSSIASLPGLGRRISYYIPSQAATDLATISGETRS